METTETETCSELDISDIAENSESFTEDRNSIREDNDSEINTVQDSEIMNTEEQTLEDKKCPTPGNKLEIVKTTRLPLARIKNIMKMDPDVSIVNAEAVFLVTKATEMFLETIVKETYTYTAQNKRKVISKKDLDVVINKVDCLCFLEGAMDF